VLAADDADAAVLLPERDLAVVGRVDGAAGVLALVEQSRLAAVDVHRVDARVGVLPDREGDLVAIAGDGGVDAAAHLDGVEAVRVLSLLEPAAVGVGRLDARRAGATELESEVAELDLLAGRVLGPVLEAGALEVLDVAAALGELAGARVAEDLDAAVGVEEVEEGVADGLVRFREGALVGSHREEAAGRQHQGEGDGQDRSHASHSYG